MRDIVLTSEELHEDESFAERELAALVAAKIYFYLGEYEDALSFALGAGALFDLDAREEFNITVISKAIDTYITERNVPDASPDKRLERIVDAMLRRSIENGAYRQALGIALETHRLDVIERVYERAQSAELFVYVLEVVMGVGYAPEARREVLNLLVRLFKSLPEPDCLSVAKCYVYLNEPAPACELLGSLLSGSDDDRLVASQIAFDLVEGSTQEFLKHVRRGLSERESSPHLERLQHILSGEETVKLYHGFLQHANHADLAILKGSKDLLDAHYSAYHSGMSLSNAFMNAGTGSDKFLRDNLEWLAKASNWSKFTATAALGVLHKGSLTEGVDILRPYLPSDGPSNSVYSEGGSLFALGLIHANHGAAVLDLLANTLRSNTAEVVQHGAALGLGAAGMATENADVYDELRNVLFSDSAVAGEAAGYAMGLVFLGTGSERATEEMLQYAHETQHEKIIRGLALGLALLQYGRQSDADAVIDVLMADKDAILRYGGIYTVALAYAGTGNNRAISRLLHVAVSDGSDDVRRAAVVSIGFLLCRSPEQVPPIVQLLSESYNPHVRYGAALALGVACAGTGLDAAVDLLEPMTKDTVDFVRQGACLALAMIFVQQNDALNPRVQSVRKTFDHILTEKHEEAMAKFGAVVAQGLIDAGGRNVTISLLGRGGSVNTSAVVGMALFTQYWYWFPMAHFAALAFTPTAVIGVTPDLRIPDVQLVSRTRPSLFAYPPPLQAPSEKKAEKVETAVLSTTAKSQARQRTKEKKKQAGAMDMDDKDDANEKEEDAKEDSKAEEVAPKPREPSFAMIQNASRVTPQQLKYVSFPTDARFVPVRPLHSNRGEIWAVPLSYESSDAVRARRHVGSATGGGSGIVLLRDRKPGEPFASISLGGDKNTEQSGAETAAAAGAAADGDTEDKGPTSVADANARPEPAAAGDVEMGDGTAR